MRLSDVDIRRQIATGDIRIVPEPPQDYFGSCSIDLSLGNQFKIFDSTKFSSIEFASNDHNINEDLMISIEIDDTGRFFLHPGEFALGITQQRLTLSNRFAGWLDGRSSLARLGLMVHITAHTIDPGWDGQLTLEFFNGGKLPLVLRPGMRICAVSFEELSSPSSKPYSSKKSALYTNQTSPRLGRQPSEP